MPLKARSGEKDPELEWIHSPVIDREESQVRASYGETAGE
jgi:hypothetical protein